jgi:serine protease Do
LVLGEDAPRKESLSGLAVATALEEVLTKVIAEAADSVVPIAIFRTGGVAETNRIVGSRGFRVADSASTPPLDAIPDAYGTGVVVNDEGLVLTNQHVVQGAVAAMRIFIRVPGRPVWDEVRIKATDTYSDLAVLEGISPGFAMRKWRPMPLGDGSKLRKGQIVVTLGNPFALASDGEVSAGWGIVSNLRRKLPPARGLEKTPRRPSMHHLGTLIQTDAKLNLGTSGGPLLNLQGKMIGLTTSLAAIEGHERAAGYALAVDVAFRRALGLLMEGREVEYGFMGIRPGELKESERVAGQRGVRVQSVINGGPVVGQVRRMDVVTHIDGKSIDSLDALLLKIGRSPAHQEVKLRVLRNGRPLSISVKLTKNRIWGESIATVQPSAWRGLRVDHPAAMRPFSDVWQIPTECVVVREVLEGSPAEKARIQPGMQIHRLGDIPTDSVAAFRQGIKDLTGAVQVQVRNLRGGPTEFFEIEEPPP